MAFNLSIREVIERDSTGLLDVHPTWSRVRLGDVVEIVNGAPFDSELFSTESGHPLVRIRDILPGHTTTFYRGEFNPTFEVTAGDLLVGMDGDFNVGHWQGPRALLNQRVCKLKADESFYSSRLLRLVLPGYLAAIHQNTPSITVKHLSSRTIGDIELPLPPMVEQVRLVDKLDELLTDLDAGVAELKTAQAKLQRYRQSLLKAAVQGDLTIDWRAANPPAETGAELLQRILAERRARWEATQRDKAEASGAALPSGWQAKYPAPAPALKADQQHLPVGWSWATTEVTGEVLLGRQRAPQYLTGRWTQRYLRVANIKDDRIDFSDVESMDFEDAHFAKYRLVEGDILVSEGQSPELVGQSAIFRGYGEPLCFQKTLHRYRASPGVALTEYAQLVFRANVCTGVFRSLASITTNIAHLTLEKFEAAPFPLPPLAEQEQIVAIAHAHLQSAGELERAIATALRQSAAQRQNILRAAFAGQLVPQDPTDEPAEALLARIRTKRECAKPPERKRAARAPARA